MQTSNRTPDRISRRSFVGLGGVAIVAALRPRVGGWSSINNGDKLILPDDTEVKTGGCRMIEIDGGYHVWTKKVGESPVKVLLLHGGPGVDHTYFECFEDFLPRTESSSTITINLIQPIRINRVIQGFGRSNGSVTRSKR